MITNEKQYKSTRLQISRFQDALLALDRAATTLPPVLAKAQRDAFASQLEELREDADLYERPLRCPQAKDYRMRIAERHGQPSAVGIAGAAANDVGDGRQDNSPARCRLNLWSRWTMAPAASGATSGVTAMCHSRRPERSSRTPDKADFCRFRRKVERVKGIEPSS